MFHYLVTVGGLLGSYLIGSLLFGHILAKVFAVGDLASQGSGNVGATNMSRVGGKWLGILTALLDCAKGYIAVVICSIVSGGQPGVAAAGGAAAVIGHIFPFWRGYRGGKGVATFLGMMLATSLIMASIFVVLWLILLAWRGIVSLASIVSIGIVGLLAYKYLPEPITMAIWMITACLIIYKHRANIQRLIRGQEAPIFKRK